jgi:hypothetical protein
LIPKVTFVGVGQFFLILHAVCLAAIVTALSVFAFPDLESFVKEWKSRVSPTFYFDCVKYIVAVEFPLFPRELKGLLDLLRTDLVRIVFLSLPDLLSMDLLRMDLLRIFFVPNWICSE